MYEYNANQVYLPQECRESGFQVTVLFQRISDAVGASIQFALPKSVAAVVHGTSLPSLPGVMI